MADTDRITFGPWSVRLINRDLDAKLDFDCLQNVTLGLSADEQEIICNILEGPEDLRRFAQQWTMNFTSQELRAKDIAAAIGGGTQVQTGTNIDRIAGPGTLGDPSSDGDAAEWHIVKIDGSDPDFTCDSYLANYNVESGTFHYYLADGTSIPTSDVSADPSLSTSGDISVDNENLGKITGTSLDSTDINEFTYDDDNDYRIHGVDPIVDHDVNQGDTVALIGFGYEHNLPKDDSGTEIPDTQRQLIEIPRLLQGQNVSLTALHRYQADPDHKALIVRVWKAKSTPNFDLTGSANSPDIIPLDFNIRSLSDSKNHPDSPHGELEIINTSQTLPDDDFAILD